MPIPPINFEPPFNITRVSHIVLTATDLEASRTFYTEVVGLIVTDEEASLFPGVKLREPPVAMKSVSLEDFLAEAK